MDQIRKSSTRDRELLTARNHATWWAVGVFLLLGISGMILHPFRGEDELLVIAYDASNEYFQAINEAFVSAGTVNNKVKAQTCGSVQQARNLARGLLADVVCVASEAEMIFVQQKTSCYEADWKDRFPHDSSPMYSTIVFLVKAGNPLGIEDWKDLYSLEIRLSLANPRISGGGRYAYLALLADALSRHGGAERKAEAEVRSLMLRADLVDCGAQQAFNIFSFEKNADVFLTWESEAIRITRQEHNIEYEIVYPSKSILAEPVLSLMDCQVEKRGSRIAATAYVEFLFSYQAQEIAAINGLRPRMPEAEAAILGGFPKVELFSVDDVFGSWDIAWRKHFGPKSTFEYILLLRAARLGGVE